MQVLVTAPIDLVKVRLQSQTTGRAGFGGDKYRGPMHCVAVILREEGVRGLFRGMWALALRDVPCYGLYFLPYELTVRLLTDKGRQPGKVTETVKSHAKFDLGIVQSVQHLCVTVFSFFVSI